MSKGARGIGTPSNAVPPAFGTASLVSGGSAQNSVVAAHKLVSVRIAERNAPLTSFVAPQDPGSGGNLQLRDNA